MAARRWIPISALNHFAYCPRRCALIHQEQVFDENRFTLEGREHHQRVDEGLVRQAHRVETAVRLWSNRMRVTGIGDVVEWHGDVPYPVEYKRGARHAWVNDDIQVCAQGLCLEEMLGVEVPAGAIFHASSRRRREVYFGPGLRAETMETIEATRRLLEAGEAPPPTEHRERCVKCSLIEICLPDLYGRSTLAWDVE